MMVDGRLAGMSPRARAVHAVRTVHAAWVAHVARAALVLASLLVFAPLPAQAADVCTNCGTIASVSTYRTEQQMTALGTVSPGTLSGDSPTGQPGRTTTQFAIGRGFSNQGVVVLGAAGGAAYARTAPNAPQTRWQIVVRMDDGSRRSLTQGYEPRFIEGDRVRVFGTQLESMQE